MPADPRDDFSIFDGSEHMFFAVNDPFAMVREELENSLRRQVPSTQVHAIRCFGEPKFLTVGRQVSEDDERMQVTHYGVCFQCVIALETEHHSQDLRCTAGFYLGDIDKAGEERLRTYIDVGDDADGAFDDEVFKGRFMQFRQDLAE
jgi:hypothetical protein